MEDYGFYVTLDIDENNKQDIKKGFIEENNVIDNEENKFYMNRQYDYDYKIAKEWCFFDTIRCMYQLVIIMINRHK